MGEKEFTKLLTPEGEDRLRVRIVIEKSKVTDVVIQYEAKLKDKCTPSYDMIARTVFSTAICLR